MNSLSITDRYNLEKFLGMSSGYVLNFSNRTFGEFVSEQVAVDIDSGRYGIMGSSKANKLRSFWKLESDHTVGKLLLALINYGVFLNTQQTLEDKALENRCRQIAARLITNAPILTPLKDHAKALDANYLAEQIQRMEASLGTDPSLAIGTAKELIETCCKTILAERGKPVAGTPDIPALTKQALKELKLVPDGIPDSAKGAGTIKRLLNNLGTIGHALAELRNLYGTGHGKHGKATGLKPRHAKLAVGAAATFATFLFETHVQTKT
ncbi:MAG: abortive infection family protein [Elusimicrobiota bacterium]